ncbi:hypothetical protein D9613_007982 [Agrocybe pediades]|uniref:Uncharacterized protein n=1 Tax=Agrocybe pediades TaxID=84607 RepID=A0A8H4VLC2_9AGAR|nr:hypothetical protein D9613_007982 [Agrocybe pediades]
MANRTMDFDPTVNPFRQLKDLLGMSKNQEEFDKIRKIINTCCKRHLDPHETGLQQREIVEVLKNQLTTKLKKHLDNQVEDSRRLGHFIYKAISYQHRVFRSTHTRRLVKAKKRAPGAERNQRESRRLSRAPSTPKRNKFKPAKATTSPPNTPPQRSPVRSRAPSPAELPSIGSPPSVPKHSKFKPSKTISYPQNPPLQQSPARERAPSPAELPIANSMRRVPSIGRSDSHSSQMAGTQSSPSSNSRSPISPSMPQNQAPSTPLQTKVHSPNDHHSHTSSHKHSPERPNLQVLTPPPSLPRPSKQIMPKTIPPSRHIIPRAQASIQRTGLAVIHHFLETCVPPMNKFYHRLVDFGFIDEQRLFKVSLMDRERQYDALRLALPDHYATEMEIMFLERHLNRYFFL